MPMDTLTELYDSQGLPPEIVKQAAEKEGVEVELPENFYALIAQRHMQSSKPAEEEETQTEKTLRKKLKSCLQLNNYTTKMFTCVNSTLKSTKSSTSKYVVLDSTCFYPEGGGQPADHGWLTVRHSRSMKWLTLRKSAKSSCIKSIHRTKFNEGSIVHGILDWDRRYSLMKAHTVTHLINGSARRVLGEHVWQSGTQKGLETSRLDITHYQRLSPDEVHKIEIRANEAIEANMTVETKWYPRNEAESRYGFRLYQGGAVPGKDIRVVKTGDWDVEACAGTHLGNTGEVGYVKIVYTERVQDGVERLGYAVGLEAVKAVQKQESILWKVSEALSAPVEKLDKTAEKIMKDLKDANIEKRRLIKELATKESTFQATAVEAKVEVGGVAIVKTRLRRSNRC